MEMQREIDAVAVICGGNSDSGGRNWVFGFDFGGRKGWVLSLGEGDFSVTNEREIFFFFKEVSDVFDGGRKIFK